MFHPNTEQLEAEKRIFRQARKRLGKCPFCSQVMKFTGSKSDSCVTARCSFKFCRRQVSLLKGTIFYNSSLGIPTLIIILDLWMNGSPTALIARLTDINLCTIRKLLRKVYKRISLRYYKNFTKLGGKEIIVEIDESKFGKRKYHKGHHVEGVWAFEMVKRTAAKRKLIFPVPDRKGYTLLHVLKRFVNPESIIYSDCWKGYSKVKDYFSGYLYVNHSLGFKDPVK